MKGFFGKNGEPTFAAGGIVLRGDREPLLALVKLRKDKSWVLPKGKLKRKEHLLAAARREVQEETGYDVAVHEFLGSMSHDVRGNLKVVQFWRMRAVGGPVRAPARDVTAVQWLPLEEALKKLTHAREQVFLANVGPAALKAAAQTGRHTPSPSIAPSAIDHLVAMAPRSTRKGFTEQVRLWFRRMTLGRPRKAR